MSVAVFGGTAEGRKIAEIFADTGIELYLCVATEYGASLLPEGKNIRVHPGRMEEREMEAFLASIEAELCIDATHPYAQDATRNIKTACEHLDLPRIRVMREEGAAGERTVCVKDAVQAADFLSGTTGRILLATGSRDLEAYTKIPDYRERCVARVLPVLSVMEKCRELGFEGQNLIAMQGPFCEEMNLAMLKQFQISWLVSKNSGAEGGFMEKCRATQRAGAGLVLIGRPQEEGPAKTLSETIAYLRERYGIKHMQKRQVYLIGAGPGAGELLTGEALRCIGTCDALIGSGRMLGTAGKFCKDSCEILECWKREEILDFIATHEEYGQIGIVYSGDIGFYSGAEQIRQDLGAYEVHPVSGISSMDYFLDRIGVSRREVLCTSCHGRDVSLIPLLHTNRKVCALAGGGDSVRRLCEDLMELQMQRKVRITAGENLSYEGERILSGTPEELLTEDWDGLIVVLIENTSFREPELGFGIKDERFQRGEVPMTKEEVRTLSLSKLGLSRDTVLYDIGAGTGSVSVEAALRCDRGRVYAVERKAQAADLIRANRIRFQVQNLTIVEGTAPECIEDLPAPDAVFLGGSAGRLIGIVEAVRRKNPRVRFVLNIITLETLALVMDLRERYEEYRDMEILQVQIAKGDELGSYHLMRAQNPVFIISFGGGMSK